MRNDARPIGEANPHGGPPDSAPPDRSSNARESVTHDPQSHIVNEAAVGDARRRRDDADVDPVMPTGDSTLKTNI